MVKEYTKLNIIFIMISILLTPLTTPAAEMKVTRVMNGDTILCEVNDIETMVRLIAIDAPEMSRKKDDERQTFSERATKFLIDLILNKVVEIKVYGLDQNQEYEEF